MLVPVTGTAALPPTVDTNAVDEVVADDDDTERPTRPQAGTATTEIQQ